MLKLFSWLLKIIPAILVSTELLLFIYNWFMQIQWTWLRMFLIIGVPVFIITNFILYFTTYKDIWERQLSKEQDENESRKFTVEIQTKRMVRKYGMIVVIGVFSAILYLYYKANVFAMIMRLVIVFLCFLFGEMLRIWNIGIINNREIKSKLKEKPKKESEN